MKKILLLLLVISCSAFAQQSIQSKVEYKPIPSSNDFAINLKLTVSDTLIDHITVTVGTEANGSDLFQKEFDYNDTGTFGDGTSLNKNGHTITISLGSFPKLRSFHGAATIVKSNSETNTVSFSR